MSPLPRPLGACRNAVLLALVCLQSGCTSVLTTASLRDLAWKAADHAAEGEPETSEADRPASDASPATADKREDTSAGDESDAGRRAAAIEEAVRRLSRLGRLDAATESTLVETLQRTQPEDWPVVIEAFAAALPSPVPAREPPAEASVNATSGATGIAPDNPDATPAPGAEPPAETATPLIAARPVTTAAEQSVPAAPEPAAPEPAAEEPANSAARPALTLQNPCFASRVRGWGDVDKFAAPRFEAGQEVIVYFELDGLAASETPAGCTTRVDTVLTLLGPDGTRLHTWRFDPLEETCKQRRRDYFARYLVVLPPAATGRCRLEVSVSDAVAASSAGATLPLNIVAAQSPR